MSKANIGLIGLAVMGQNLVLNMERNGYTVAVFNRTTARTDEFVSRHPERKLVPTHTLAEFVASLQRPRIVMIMVQAGTAVDRVMAQLIPLLEPDDLILDNGNSHFHDTDRRWEQVRTQELEFMGVGVSGGEEGALRGPSIMPGGSREAYTRVATVFTAISAKAPSDGDPCVDYMGPRGAGHYVKMVHNAIEYGDMQLIAECYDLMQRGLGLDNTALADVFAAWNEAELDSFLIEITAQIFRAHDPESATSLVDLVLDTAAQKGTGKWASQDAFDIGAPIPTINAAVVGRILSSQKEERVHAAQHLPGPVSGVYEGDRAGMQEAIRQALYASKISAYAQGMAMMGQASLEYGYELNLGRIAAVWRAGCIIRARFLEDITNAYTRNPDLANLLLDPVIRQAVALRLPAWRRVVATAVQLGIPVPALSASLAYYDAYRSARLPANLIQAQRDLFGAHTYQRIDREGTFHSDWV